MVAALVCSISVHQTACMIVKCLLKKNIYRPASLSEYGVNKHEQRDSLINATVLQHKLFNTLSPPLNSSHFPPHVINMESRNIRVNSSVTHSSELLNWYSWRLSSQESALPAGRSEDLPHRCLDGLDYECRTALPPQIYREVKAIKLFQQQGGSWCSFSCSAYTWTGQYFNKQMHRLGTFTLQTCDCLIQYSLTLNGGIHLHVKVTNNRSDGRNNVKATASRQLIPKRVHQYYDAL